MLSSSQRLATKQLEEVLKKGKVIHSSFFWLRFTKNNSSTRISVIVPQKIVKSAVVRNNLRRKVYNSISLFVNKIKQGCHIIVCIKDPVIKAETLQIQEKAKEIFVATGLLE